MASKKKKQKTKQESLFSGQSSVVRTAIGGVLIAASASFLGLAAFGSAGIVGTSVYNFLEHMIGIGYWLLVIGLGLIAYTLLRRTAELPKAGWVHLVAGAVLLVTLLALADIAVAGAGGLLGSVIAGAVISVLSVYAGTIILETVAVVTLLVVIDEYVDLTKEITMPTMALPSGLRELVTGQKSKVESQEDNVKVHTASDEDPAPTSSDDSGEGASDDQSNKEKGKDPVKESDDSHGAKGNYKIAAYKNNNEKEPSLAASPEMIGDYTPPPASLLSRDSGKPEVGDVKARANLIKRTLENFNIDVAMDEVSIGPTVTRYALKPAEGVRLNKITNLQNNLELALAAHPVRIEAPIPGKSLVGIEVPNNSKTTVGLAGLLGSKQFQDDEAPLLMGLGQGISGNRFFADLNKMPHLLIGGATGAGKSVTVHALMNSLLFRNGPQNLKLIMVDPKRVELTLYNGIPHLLTPVITSAKKAILAMKWAAKEMDRRYDILEEEGVRDIKSYQENVLPKLRKSHKEGEPRPDPMPYIVIVIDEMADLMSAYPKELEAVIVRIAQMSRAVGIHLILSTQRPDVSVITGIIKANIPARIALQVSSQIDSRTILDSKGAEQLLGAGDMLYQSGDMSKPVRIQSAFISETEVKKVVSHLKKQYEDQLQDTVNLSKAGDDDNGKTIFDVAKEVEEEEDRDEKYEEAMETVVEAGKASTSYLQRKLRVGYSRAARIMDELEETGIIAEKDGTKAREVLISKRDLEKIKAGDPTPTSSDDSGEGAGEKDESTTKEAEEKGEMMKDEKNSDNYDEDDYVEVDENVVEDDPDDSSEEDKDPKASRSERDARASKDIDDKYFEALDEE